MAKSKVVKDDERIDELVLEWITKFLDKYLFVIFDGGNSDLKGTTLNNPSVEVIMPNAVREEVPANYKARVRRFKHYGSDDLDSATSVFQIDYNRDGKSSDVVNYLVGKEALQSGTGNSITGPAKFTDRRLQPLVMAMLQKLAPDGHANVFIAIAHPPDSISKTDQIADLLNGKHNVIKYDGKKISYNVKGVIPWDEPGGGLVRFMTKEYAEYNPLDLRSGQMILVIDIGGGISTLTPVEMLGSGKTKALFNESKPIGLGILDILEKLETELKDLHPEVFEMKSIPNNMLQECIRHQGWMTIKGERFDATQAYLNATEYLLSEIENLYRNSFGSGINFVAIVVTGGGGGLMFKALCDEVLDHNYVHLADEERRINLANVRGGRVIARDWLYRYATNKVAKERA